ncbi:MAG: 7-cyano-7-deazaguanine synthase [Pirellulales bacterium]
MPSPLASTQPPAPSPTLGVLLSGGLDSAILVGRMLAAGRTVQPFFIETGTAWERAERYAVKRFLSAVAPNGDHTAALRPLVRLAMPLADVYGPHWSLNGDHVPDAASPDEAVYLPGRNLLLLSKVAVWCQSRGIDTVALAVLRGNPFPDARDEFFAAFERLQAISSGKPLRIERPFSQLNKADVLRLGRGLPLELTFSCIAPVDGRHCGACNKCAERIRGFADADFPDPTEYDYGVGPIF